MDATFKVKGHPYKELDPDKRYDVLRGVFNLVDSIMRALGIN